MFKCAVCKHNYRAQIRFHSVSKIVSFVRRERSQKGRRFLAGRMERGPFRRLSTSLTRKLSTLSTTYPVRSSSTRRIRRLNKQCSESSSLKSLAGLSYPILHLLKLHITRINRNLWVKNRIANKPPN